jgi:hypothetical protein
MFLRKRTAAICQAHCSQLEHSGDFNNWNPNNVEPYGLCPKCRGYHASSMVTNREGTLSYVRILYSDDRKGSRVVIVVCNSTINWEVQNRTGLNPVSSAVD